jgi:glucose/mannose transport system substrate-binding protein
MRTTATIAAFLGFSSVAAACHHLDTCDTATSVVEVFTWWAKPEERAAIEAVIGSPGKDGEHQRHYPKAYVIHSTMGSHQLQVDFLGYRVSSQNYPGTFQISFGTDVLSWVDQNIVEPLDWRAIGVGNLGIGFHPALVSTTSQKGDQYLRSCVPIDIHRSNTLYYSPSLLDEMGIPPESLRSLDGFRAACATLKSRGITPIVLGTQNADWALALVLHENLLPAMAGPAYYERFWNGDGSADDSLAAVYQELINWSSWQWINNDDFETLSWDTAASRLLVTDAKRAGFYIMGDWVSGTLKAESQKYPSQEFASVPFPGVVPFFVYTSDCFPLPRGAPDRTAATQLLSTFASPQGQLVFSQKKGSIPARMDIPAKDQATYLDKMQLETFAYLSELPPSQVLLAVSGMAGLARADKLKDLNGTLVRMLKARDVQVAMDYWRDHYADLR